MELVNKKYIKFDMPDKELENLFTSMNATILYYETNNRSYIEEVFISVDSLPKRYRTSTPIKRNILRNAYVYANLNSDSFEASVIARFLNNKSVMPFELDDILDYVLEHSKDLNEIYDGEKIRFIYDVENDSLDKDYIYGDTKKNNGNSRKILDYFNKH